MKKKSKREKIVHGLRSAFEHVNTGTDVLAAAAHGQWGKVRILARMGYTVNDRNSWIIAKIGESGDAETLDLVIKKGANMKARDRHGLGIIRGQQALNMAALNNNHAVIPALVRHGADITDKGYKAIRIAAENGHTKALFALLGHCKDPMQATRIAFQVAVENNQMDCVHAISERVSKATLQIWLLGRHHRRSSRTRNRPAA